MIGKLKGIVDETGEDHAGIDVNGVGYMVHCSARTLQALPLPGEPVTLYIETHVREDMIRLYGFQSVVEREWFRLLQTVQGVGAKVALAMLAALTPSDLGGAIAGEDKALVAKTPGVGPKLAARIVTELKGRVPDHLAVDPTLAASVSQMPPAFADAVSALMNLGYAKSQAAAAVARVAGETGADASAGTLIRQGLRILASAA